MLFVNTKLIKTYSFPLEAYLFIEISHKLSFGNSFLRVFNGILSCLVTESVTKVRFSLLIKYNITI